MPDLLLELGLEEIPARMIPSAEAELLRRTLALLGKEALLAPTFDPVTDARSYSTPRRLAVLISGVIAQQPDLTEDVTGPAVKIAYKDGVPTPAAEAFAKKNGIAVADLKTISTPRGDYLAASVTKKGRSASEVLTTELPKEIAALYWAKNMRWIPQDRQTFVRPVLWLVCLLGDTVVPFAFGGRTAARASYGHRVLSNGEPFEIQTPDSYLAQLEGEYVLADVEVRRQKIRKALDHVTRTIPAAKWREDHPLVDKMTHLTEWPDVLLGSFEPSYLALPEEVLVTVMRDHQNYFALEGDLGTPSTNLDTTSTDLGAPSVRGSSRTSASDVSADLGAPSVRGFSRTSASNVSTDLGAPSVRGSSRTSASNVSTDLGAPSVRGFSRTGGGDVSGGKAAPANKLLPNFLAITNISLNETNAPIIKQGNERVLRARFNDAQFFWNFDQKTSLTERIKLLESVTFQKDLGSYALKSKEVAGIAALLATEAKQRGASLDAEAIALAAQLAKTDLTTELVKEFTELQGIIGGLYAKSQGVSATVAEAIYDQYLPASADDSIPRSAEGCILGLADRVHTIAGMFGLGMEPTGSKDPFALRRAANSIVKILAEGPLPLLLSNVVGASAPKPEVFEKLNSFFAERVDFYLRESRGQSYDVVKAVMASGYDNLHDTVARAEAVSSMRGSADFLAVSAAFKRMKNILAQANFELESGVPDIPAENSPERDLLRKYADLDAKVGRLANERKYREALEATATIRPEVDSFFEKVMVNDPDPKIRERRLALLAIIVKNFSGIADFSEIVTAG
jgi:glycyl-tRNA synthetase beta subunit